MTQLLSASISDATKRTYRNAMSIYTSFYESEHENANSIRCLPISEQDMAKFILHLVNKGYKSASIQTNVSALGYCHNILGLPNPANKFLITKLLAGAKRLAPSQDKRLPVTLHMLHNFIQIIKRLYPAVYERRMYTAMLLLAFHAFLRIGEYTTRGGRQTHVIQRDKIKFSVTRNKVSKVAITMLHYKHSRGEVTLVIEANDKRQYCPVNALARYISLEGPCIGPIFINQDGSTVSTSQFSTVFRQVVIDAKLDPKKYKPHGLRIGAATRAHAMNLSDSQIREMGRWKSESFKRYIRIPMAK